MSMESRAYLSKYCTIPYGTFYVRPPPGERIPYGTYHTYGIVLTTLRVSLAPPPGLLHDRTRSSSLAQQQDVVDTLQRNTTRTPCCKTINKMAKTKNTSKCTVPKHKQRVTKKTIVSSKTKVLSKTRISSPRGGCTSYKRGEEVDFSELSHWSWQIPRV